MDSERRRDIEQIKVAVADLCSNFKLDYWSDKDRDCCFPEEFYKEFAAHGWLGTAIPTEYGGVGLGISEVAAVMHTVAASGGGLSACSSIHLNVFGINPVVVFGSREQKERILPPLVRGEAKACFAVTEPDAGLDTGRIKTKAERSGNFYYVAGEKVWISTAQVAENVLLLARTVPIKDCVRPIDGLSLFYTKLDRRYVDIHAIEKMGRNAVDSNRLTFDGMPVPVADLIGEEGKGFQYILHGMNPERILVAVEAVGIGQAALQLAVQYAKDRIVFDRPIGQNQSIQHPLARAWAELEAAKLMAEHAAELYDDNQPCGFHANAAKLLAADASINACKTAMLTHGGYGYAKEYHVERLLREALLTYIVPVSPQMILNNIAEKKLGLPRSY